LGHRDAIDRLGVAADVTFDAERQAARDLAGTRPTTVAGAAALVEYMSTMIG
jgi:hypothetical protein